MNSSDLLYALAAFFAALAAGSIGLLLWVSHEPERVSNRAGKELRPWRPAKT